MKKIQGEITQEEYETLLHGRDELSIKVNGTGRDGLNNLKEMLKNSSHSRNHNYFIEIEEANLWEITKTISEKLTNPHTYLTIFEKFKPIGVYE